MSYIVCSVAFGKMRRVDGSLLCDIKKFLGRAQGIEKYSDCRGFAISSTYFKRPDYEICIIADISLSNKGILQDKISIVNIYKTY